MLEYITIAISSILAIIAASLNTEKSENGEIKTVLKKPNIVGYIVISLIVAFAFTQIILQNKQKKDQDTALGIAEERRKMEVKDMAELLRRAKEDSITLAIQIEQLDSQKYQLSNQIHLSGKLVKTQEFAIKKTEEYNASLKKELEKQTHSLLPLRLLFTIETPGKDIIKTMDYKITIDSILNSYKSGIKSSEYDITENFDSTYNIKINSSKYIPEQLKFARLDIGFYKSVNKENIKSIVFQWDSTLLRLRFDDLNILSYWTNSYNYKTNIWYEAVKSGKVMNENRKIHSSLELNNLFLNVHFPHSNFEIKQIMLISGKQNEEIYKKLGIKEIYKDLYIPGNGKWYKIEMIE